MFDPFYLSPISSGSMVYGSRIPGSIRLMANVVVNSVNIPFRVCAVYTKGEDSWLYRLLI